MDTTKLFCHDLPSTPVPEIGKILVTGATGYIGGRLIPELLHRGYDVRIMVRAMSPEYEGRWPGAEIVVADVLEEEALKDALDGIHTAYYLIHSMLLGKDNFKSADRRSAKNFGLTAKEKGIQRIIYLGGLGDTQTSLSPHLRSRIEVADELNGSGVPTTILRAAIIIGSGSASYEIIENLIKNLPLLLIPHWGKNKCQPIGIRDVIKYLVGALEKAETSGKPFDIGGSDVLTYEEMLKKLAQLFGKKMIFIPTPVSNISFLAYVASLVTPVPTPIIRCLMEGLRDEVICECKALPEILPFDALAYEDMILRAMSREEQDKVYTRWSDAYPPAHELALRLHELEEPPKYTSSYFAHTKKDPTSLFNAFCKIGGKEGWFNSNWMWQLRGAMDRLLMGVGTARGRRMASTLAINDVIDFWRVENLERNKLLLLRAEMKLPGRAWLEFRIEEKSIGNNLHIRAYYQTQSILGIIYWYLLLPFHGYIFKDLLKEIIRQR
ncbi:MAG: SDR family oxidoreductase [Anaerolineales bacterium]|uniref:SDR family oxidoreductase n=1 Tax=Candidatus Desulfolinea nitratireducens TaxID=2841698 RepID=A0A8J6NH54_9CHLR|nr:SDR family oxidoreductase [Candidatus Desulfolinea nitratireducens]MBL6960696.1 SDR family oxidoreductase [Anaerolineales bacterium]